MNTTDLIGKKFNKLTVIKFDRIEYKRDSKGKNRNKGYWLCRCDCGKEVSIARNDLVTGKTKSCGCLNKEKWKKRSKIGKRRAKDLTGQRFNKLLVIGLDRVEERIFSNGKKNNIYYWKCRCDCGEEVIVSGRRLKDGRIKDCKDVKRNELKTYTQIGNEFKKKNILKEGTRLDNLSGKLSKANTSGVRGVSFKKDKNKYKATIGFKKKTHFLGYFDNIEDAKKAREKAEDKYYKPILEKYGYKSRKDKEIEEEFE